VIRVDAVWLAVDPIDLRAGMESALGRVVSVFGAAHPRRAYVFLSRRGDRMKTLVQAPVPAHVIDKGLPTNSPPDRARQPYR
jgi:hypothetical protein